MFLVKETYLKMLPHVLRSSKKKMNPTEIFGLFKQMIELARSEIVKFTLSQSLSLDFKADKTVVTSCDIHIDNLLFSLARKNGFCVISEEGDKSNTVLKNGNYMTIDPIDGSLGYIENVNHALAHGGIKSFLTKDLGPESDFCLLIGIVINGTPRYGCCYNYITQEKILLDAENPMNCIIENERRAHSGEEVCYISPRPGNALQERILSLQGVKKVIQATMGLKSLYSLLCNHKSAIVVHKQQESGLWDILPAAVAARAFGGKIIDGSGNEVMYNSYINIPNGVLVIKGPRFVFVQSELKNKKTTILKR